jgi:naphthalene 1,2-dioxygenase ferredoxin reductase component
MTDNPRHRLRCRVAALEEATHDVRIVRLEILDGGALPFHAGQYAQVAFADYPARDYSMANRPGKPGLEFHIRDMKTGGASGFVARALSIGDPVRVAGPLGRVVLDEHDPGPIVAVAGGSGLAPMKSVVETALAKGMTQPISLYFGAGEARDIYLEDHFAGLMARHANFHFIPVVERADEAGAHRTGLVTDALAQDTRHFEGAMAYLAGPPAMIEAAAALLARLGLTEARILADPFYSDEENAARRAAGLT